MFVLLLLLLQQVMSVITTVMMTLSSVRLVVQTQSVKLVRLEADLTDLLLHSVVCHSYHSHARKVQLTEASIHSSLIT